MNLQSISQDLEIEYYAMMSRVVQFTRTNTLKNAINVKIPRTTLESANVTVLDAVNVEIKNQREVAATA